MRGLAAIAASSLLLATAPAAGANPASPGHRHTYSNAKFVEHRTHHTFGQDPVFTPGGRVVVGEDRQSGGAQIYISHRSGSHRKCLTCTLKGPNNVPIVRPQGDWILFHSWAGHSVTLGSPGYGGIGSELYVMRPNGSHATKLYGTNAKNGYGEGTDDYHAYWSPDGRRIVWAHFNGNFIDGGGKARWDIRVANFVVRNGTPRLTHVRVVRPANTHWYETQWWAPNGKGFLYTESFGSAVNTDLFYCRLPKHGTCHVTRLTHNPAWDEQAIFTPNGKNIIFMSSRDHPGFFNTYSAFVKALEVKNNLDNFLILPVFELAFLQPVAQERTDLYELHLKTHSIRRLTRDGNHGWIIPEFTWTPNNRQLFWTQSRYPKGVGVALPLNIKQQIKGTVRYIRHPSIKNIQAIHGNALSAVPLQRRTKYAHFRGVKPPGSSRVSAAMPAIHAAAVRRRPLAGKTIGIDPGHNGRNYTDPAYINRQVWNGREREACDTTGTSTNGGYPEPRFTWRVAVDLRQVLRREGARVVMTRHNNHGVGPCINRRARIINHAHSSVAIDIHGDGGPSGGRGFTVLEPVRDKYNRHVVGKSDRFGHMLHHQMLKRTTMPVSTYDGVNGYTHRNDLAGLNLTKVPKVLIECGNMRNSTDARLMTSSRFQHRLARAFAKALTKFALRHHHH